MTNKDFYINPPQRQGEGCDPSLQHKHPPLNFLLEPSPKGQTKWCGGNGARIVTHSLITN